MVKTFEQQMSLFGPAPPPAAQPKAKGSSLERLTWIDEVDLGDSQTPASQLPAWKLSFQKGDVLKLNPSRPDARLTIAVVTHSTSFPADFTLPVMVQVMVCSEDGEPLTNTTLPATAVEKHVPRK